MPLPSSFVGVSSELHVAEIDPRWTMAYAAALGDLKPCYMDTREPASFLAHPLFPVCFEWPVIVSMRGLIPANDLPPEEFRRNVHATHDLLIHRPIRPPEKLSTRATIVSVERRKPGAYQVTRVETVDEAGAPVCTSLYGAIYREVEVSGADKPLVSKADLPRAGNVPKQPRAESVVHVGGGMAHIYTECARIFNPIHTDLKVARDAGLPALILHGTGTLALAVSQIVESQLDGDSSRVARIAGRFSAMVLMPSDIVVRTLSVEPYENAKLVRFEVLNQDGARAISDGAILAR